MYLCPGGRAEIAQKRQRSGKWTKSRVKVTRRKSHARIACKWKSCQAIREPEALHYVTEIAIKQHATLSRLKKPDNGKRTLGACKETGQRRWKENGTVRKRIKRLEHGYK
jgi:hypothetical protein